MERIVNPIIGNYYGAVEVYAKDNKYYLTLGDWDVHYGVEISQDLAMAIKEYFKTDRKIEKIVL